MAGQPTKIGKYDVLREIGRGGMGKVYAAVDPTIGRMVAIKQVTAVVSDDPDLLKRFYREAQSTGKLQHPNIVTLYDLGEQDGIPYLVMEYLEGESLEKVIQERRPYTVAEKLTIIIQVCEGLAYAHQREIIHRDIKPGNIVVLNDGGVKIVDFGIAQFGNERYTRTGQVVGSLYYMSPEQIQDAGIDLRSDIYSTGILLYEFLTGSVPFRGRDPASTLAKILNDTPASLANSVDTYSPDLDVVVRRALAKDRNSRYGSMDDFAFDLRTLREKLSLDLIAGLLRNAENLTAAKQWEKGREQLSQILKLDRQHRRANELMREVQTQIQRQQLSEQVHQLRLKADEALGLRNWDEALALLDRAVKIDSNNTELIRFRDSVLRSSMMLTDALRRAESAHNIGDLDNAKRAVDEALSVDPYNTTAKALNAILSKELNERAKRKKVEDFVAAARKEIALRHFNSALEMLRSAEAVDPTAADVQQLIRSAIAGLEHEKRRAALEKACSEIEDLLNRDEYSAACEKADEGLRIFPQDLGLLKLKGFAEKQREAWIRRQFLEAQITTAKQLADAEDYLRAQRILNEAMERYPDDTGVISLLGIVTDGLARQDAQRRERERQANEKRRFIRMQLETAATSLQAGQTAEALKIIRNGLAHHPDSEELKQRAANLEEVLAKEEALRKRAEEEERRRRAEVEKTIAESWQLLSSKQTGQAVVLLDRALQRHPENVDLKSQLEFAKRRLAVANAERERAEQEVRRRTAEIQKEAVAVHRLLDSGQIDQAIAALEQALSRYSDSEDLKSLLQVAYRRQAAQRAERDLAEREGRQKQAEIEREIRAAAELLDTKRTGESIDRLQRALNRHPNSEELKQHLAYAKQRLAAEEAAKKKAEEEERRVRAWVDAEITMARQWLNDKHADRAVTKLTQALNLYPESEALKAHLDFAKQRATQEKAEREQAELEARRRREAINEAIRNGLELLDAQKTAEAIADLEKASLQFPESQDLRSQLDVARGRFAEEEAERQRVAEGRRRRQAEIDRSLSSAQKFLETDQASRAASVLELAFQRYPDSGELRAQLEQARRAEAAEEVQRRRIEDEKRDRQDEIKNEIAAATLLQNAGQTTQAIERLEALLRRFPESEELKVQLKRATDRVAEEEAARLRAEQKKRQRETEIANAIASARRLLDSNQTGPVVAVLEQSSRQFPESVDLKGLLDAARVRFAAEQAERERAEKKAQQRRAEIDREIASARRLLQSEQNSEAVALLETSVQRFNESAELNDLLRSAKQQLADEIEQKHRAEDERKRRNAEIEAQVAGARALLESKQAAKVVSALGTAIRTYPESEELRSLLTLAQRTLAQEQATREKAEREAQERQEKITTEVEKGKRLLKANRASQALAALDEALSRFPESEELRSQLAAAKQQQTREIAEREKEEKRQARLREEISKSQTLLDSGEPEKALNAADAAIRTLGKDEQLQQLLDKAKLAVKLKKAEEKKRTAELQLIEEKKRQRNRDLEDLRKLSESMVSAKGPGLEKLLRKAGVIAARYPNDAEFQQTLSAGRTTTESVETEPIPSSETRLATKLFRAERVGEDPAVSMPLPPQPRPTELSPSPSLLLKLLNKWSAIGIAALIVVVVVIKLLNFPKPPVPKTYVVSIDSEPIGASVRIGDQACVTPNCRLNLPAGDFKLEAELQGYESKVQSVAIDPQNPISELKLVFVAPPPPEKAGYLLIKAGLAGADVLVDGNRRSQTSAAGILRLSLDPGTYSVEVQKQGYTTAKSSGVLIRKGQETAVELTLPALANVAELVITRAVPNVQVLADGREVGHTDSNGALRQSIEPGSHEIMLEEAGRRSNAIRRTFTAGRPTDLEGNLFAITPRPKPLSQVVINHLPNGAIVKTEGVPYSADQTGTVRFDLVAGDHTLEISAEGFRAKQIRQTFSSGPITLDGSLDHLDLEGPEWAKVESSNDMAALQGFLNSFPKGKNVAQAQSRLDRLIASDTSEKELNAFYERFPHTAAGEAAEKRAEELRTEAKTKEQDQQEILSLLQRYQAAYQQLDLKTLTEIYPEWSSTARKATQAKFKNALSVSITLNHESSDIKGDQAVMKVTQTLRWNQKDGSNVEEKTPQLSWQFAKKDGRWLIQKGP